MQFLVYSRCVVEEGRCEMFLSYHISPLVSPPSTQNYYYNTTKCASLMGWHFNGPFPGAFYHIRNYLFISFFRNNVSTQVLATLPKDFSQSIKGTLSRSIFKTCDGARTPPMRRKQLGTAKKVDISYKLIVIRRSLTTRD